MKLALAISTPEIKATVPVALLSGSFAERLRKAADLGYEGVELMVARPDELDMASMRGQIAECGLEVAAIGSGAIAMVDQLTLLAADETLRAHAIRRLDRLLEFAQALEAPLVTIGSFRGRIAGRDMQAARGILAGILRAAAEQAGKRGVRLVLEPLNRYETDIINNVEEGLAFVEEVGHPHLGLLVDTFHANIEEASMAECFRQALQARRLWHVHLGDSNRLPPGQGHIDFAEIVSVLHEGGYKGALSAELLPQPDPDSAAAMTIHYLSQLIHRYE
jgi:sugar phosphate isomerase/epimerase